MNTICIWLLMKHCEVTLFTPEITQLHPMLIITFGEKKIKKNEQIKFDSEYIKSYPLNNTHIKKNENTHTEKSNWECMYRINKQCYTLLFNKFNFIGNTHVHIHKHYTYIHTSHND